MKLKKIKLVIFVKIKSHAAQELETKSGANVENVNPRLIILKAFASWKPMIFSML